MVVMRKQMIVRLPCLPGCRPYQVVFIVGWKLRRLDSAGDRDVAEKAHAATRAVVVTQRFGRTQHLNLDDSLRPARVPEPYLAFTARGDRRKKRRCTRQHLAEKEGYTCVCAYTLDAGGT